MGSDGRKRGAAVWHMLHSILFPTITKNLIIMKKLRLMFAICKSLHPRSVIPALLLVTMCFNMFAVYVSPPDNLRLVEDSDYVDLPVDNLLPLEEIMDSTEPQVVVAHIIGMWPYVYPLWVYLAEYQG